MNTIKNTILMALLCLSLKAQEHSPIYDWDFYQEEFQFSVSSGNLLYFRHASYVRDRWEMDPVELLILFVPSVMTDPSRLDYGVSVNRACYSFESVSWQYGIRFYGACRDTLGFDLVSDRPATVEYRLDYVPLLYEAISGRIFEDWGNAFAYDGETVVTGPTGVYWDVRVRHRLNGIQVNLFE